MNKKGTELWPALQSDLTGGFDALRHGKSFATHAVRLDVRPMLHNGYVGSARGESLDRQLGEHQAGTYAGYTSTRRPVVLV